MIIIADKMELLFELKIKLKMFQRSNLKGSIKVQDKQTEKKLQSLLLAD